MGSNAPTYHLEGSWIFTVCLRCEYPEIQKILLQEGFASRDAHQDTLLELINRNLLEFMLHFSWPIPSRFHESQNLMSTA